MLSKKICTYFSFLLITTNLFAQQNITQWQHTNGPLGGQVLQILETNSGDLLAGTRLGGIFRSSDKGQSWSRIPESTGAPLLFRSIWDLVKNSQGHIFAATNNGVYRSLDNGETWQVFEEGFVHRFVEALAINSIDVLFAGTRAGVFRSEDNGETWVEFNNGLTNTFVTAVAINSLGDVFAGTQSGVFFSDDNGDNWSERSTGIIGNKQVNTMFVTPDDTLFTGTFDGLFRSHDYGMNWSRVLQAGTPIALALSPTNLLVYGSAGRNIYRSIDNGLTWSQGGGVAEIGGFYDFLFLGETDLLAATFAYGIGHSTDNGDTWTPINTGFNATEIDAMAKSNSGDLFAGGDNGLFRSGDGGETWDRLSITNLGTRTDFIASNTTGRLFASLGSVLAISDDNGDTWIEADSTFDTRFPECVAFYGDSVVYVGLYEQAYKSTNNGDTWTEVSNGLPVESVQAMCVISPDTALAGTDREGIYRTTDGGANWVLITEGIAANFEATAFVKDPGGDVLVAGFGGVYRSSDKGASWQEGGTTPFSDIKDFIRGSDGNLYIGGRGVGVAVSEDNGESWVRFNNGLEHPDVSALVLDDSGSLYAGTRGGGVFKTQFIPTSVRQAHNVLPEAFSLEQNYPNPFNPETTIRFSIPQKAQVELTVYNLLGEHITTLVDKEMEPGTYHSVFNASDFPSGIYFYKISTGAFKKVRKFTLLK